MIILVKQLRLRISNVLKRVVIVIHCLNVLEIMNKELINRINQSKIIYQTLGDVTTAPNNK